MKRTRNVVLIVVGALVLLAVVITVPLVIQAQASAAQSARYKACMQGYERYNPNATVDAQLKAADKCEASARR